MSANATIGTPARTIATAVSLPLTQVQKAVLNYIKWLSGYGETSHDFQSYYMSSLGKWAKTLYYEHRLPGTIAVLPMVFSEALAPSARALFAKRHRFPIADAHFAMGFALLGRALNDSALYRRAEHFLAVLEETRCPAYAEHCWGYPFDWVTVRGTISAGTPLITTVPYVYEAFETVYRIDGNSRWRGIMRSIAQHALDDYQDFPTSATAASCSYTPAPRDSIYVVNANAYRAFLLTSASIEFDDARFRNVADRNLNFALEAQNSDGSWYYAKDGQRSFVDHFHTCFVLKALTKIEALTGRRECTAAIERGVEYYVQNLFDEKGLPRPFARAPRLTVYRRELYDYAECINLAVLLRGRCPQLDARLNTVLQDILTNWQTKEGSFRSRRLYFGWDNTPMHRWASSQLFRSLCLLLASTTA
jgi:hypothetical protein